MITVNVRLYTILRHRADGEIRSRLTLELPAGATVEDVLQTLDVSDDLPIVMTVNAHNADATTALQAGDTVELIPAIAGGV